MRRRWVRSALACAAVVLGCARAPVELPLAFPTRTAPAPGNNWPISPARAEQLFAQAPIELRSFERTEHGVSGALKAAVLFPPDPRPVAVKWKLVASNGLEHRVSSRGGERQGRCQPTLGSQDESEIIHSSYGYERASRTDPVPLVSGGEANCRSESAPEVLLALTDAFQAVPRSI
jgi:hypothetical protein